MPSEYYKYKIQNSEYMPYQQTLKATNPRSPSKPPLFRNGLQVTLILYGNGVSEYQNLIGVRSVLF
jgi:hypothetical protein